MKKYLIIFTVLSLFTVINLSAQTDGSKDNSGSNSKKKSNDIINNLGKQAGLNDLMGQFVKGINPSSFTDGKTGKGDVLSMLSGADVTDYLKYASVAGSLAGALKSTSFLPDWSKNEGGVLEQLQNAASIADVAGGVLEMSSMLDPSSFTKGFKKKKSSWTSALSILSMLK